jgi:hypothetical protein
MRWKADSRKNENRSEENPNVALGTAIALCLQNSKLLDFKSIPRTESSFMIATPAPTGRARTCFHRVEAQIVLYPRRGLSSATAPRMLAPFPLSWDGSDMTVVIIGPAPLPYTRC